MSGRNDCRVTRESCRTLAAAGCLALLACCISCSGQPAGSGQTPAPHGNAANNPETPAPETPETPEPETPQPDRTGQVLRHAVFFSFKETSSDEDVQRIVDAFRALPDKIDEIIDLRWGTNNSPEGLDDGFTHCFFLTFKDEAGRAAYLPHPAHKAFGDVLRGHNDQVFVVDYWGTPQKEPLEKELKHAVFFKFKDDAKPEDVKAVEEAFAALPEKIDTIKAFEWGTNNSPEKHSHGFTHCFMVSFDTEEGRAAYLPHEAHQAFVEQLKPVLDKVRVLDFWAEE